MVLLGTSYKNTDQQLFGRGRREITRRHVVFGLTLGPWGLPGGVPVLGSRLRAGALSSWVPCVP